MAEPISPARLAWIRDTYADDDIVSELVNEIDRLSAEDPLVTAMNKYVAKLKRRAIEWTAYGIAGGIVYNVCTRQLGLPTWAAIAACLGIGVVIGACQALIEARQEARRG